MTVVDIEPSSLPALRFHQLRRIGQSPAHYKAQVEGDTTSVAPTGTALHSVLLGGQHVTYYDRVTEDGKAAPRRGQHWEAFKAAHPDSLILSRAEVEQVDGMVQSVRACPEALRVLDGVKEQSLYWDRLGRNCRGTPDVLSDQYITDLKSTRTSDPRRFMWEMLKYGYHAQLAWYLDGAQRLGMKPDAAFIVAVENSAPYVTTVFRLTPRALDAGARLINIWMETLEACEAIDHWPGYSQCVVALDVPERDDVEAAEEDAA